MSILLHILDHPTRWLLILCVLLSACQRNPQSAATISFSKVPAINPDNDSGGVGTIEGIIRGVQSGQRVVLYSKSGGRWWLQDQPESSVARLSSDGKWTDSTRFGIAYAALLVDQKYDPPAITESLPAVGDHIAAVAVAKAEESSAPAAKQKLVNFAGYQWVAREGVSHRAGSENWFNPANVWTDNNGALHLRITKNQDRWTCAEVRLDRSLGYGMYRFRLRDTSHLEPAAVLTLVAWDGLGGEQDRRELDVEISRWGYVKNENAHYVVQPYYVPTNMVRFQAPSGILVHSFDWEPGQATFSTVRGSTLVNRHVFTSGVPSPDGHSVRISLFAFARGRTTLQNENEAVIEAFEYLP